jgi:RecA-family ATPase
MKYEEVQSIIKTIDEAKIKPALIVIDTLARNMVGDESSTKDMNSFISCCTKLQEHYKCSNLIVHHTGKDLDKKARGAVSFSGACDTMIELSGKTSSQIKVRCEKQKDTDEFPIYLLTTQVVDSSLVLNYAGTRQDEVKEQQDNKLIPVLKLIRFNPDCEKKLLMDKLNITDKQARLILDKITDMCLVNIKFSSAQGRPKLYTINEKGIEFSSQ